MKWYQDWKMKIEDETALKMNEAIALGIAGFFTILWITIKIHFWDFLL